MPPCWAGPPRGIDRSAVPPIFAPVPGSAGRHLRQDGMGRFASTVDYYERCRPGYSRLFFKTVAQSLGLDGRQRLIDLGTGPGLLAIGFAPFVAEVVGVDPEP